MSDLPGVVRQRIHAALVVIQDEFERLQVDDTALEAIVEWREASLALKAFWKRVKGVGRCPEDDVEHEKLLAAWHAAEHQLGLIGKEAMEKQDYPEKRSE